MLTISFIATIIISFFVTLLAGAIIVDKESKKSIKVLGMIFLIVPLLFVIATIWILYAR